MSNDIYAHNTPTSPTSPYNSLRFAIELAKNAMMTCTIVQVKNVTTKGDVAPIGRVEVQPLVQMIDGISQTVDHVSVYNLPYVRIVGGTNALIMDPKKDDIGIVVVADRDISGVKNTKKVSPPGSRRRYNISDGIFIGSVLSETPTSYWRWDEDGNLIGSPDSETTFVSIKPDEVRLHATGISVYVTPNRIDLGMKNAPHAVVTVDGPSQKVYAVINESDS